MTSGCTWAQSFLPKLQLSVWLSLDLSLVTYYDADLRPLVCFGKTNRRSRTSGLGLFAQLSDVGDIRVCARLHREPCRWSQQRFAFFHVLPTPSFLHIFLFQVTSKTARRSLSRGWWCSAVSRATLFCRSSPTEIGQSPRSPMSIRLPCCGRQKQVKLAMDVVERKEAMQEKSENDARPRKDWVATW